MYRSNKQTQQHSQEEEDEESVEKQEETKTEEVVSKIKVFEDTDKVVEKKSVSSSQQVPVVKNRR